MTHNSNYYNRDNQKQPYIREEGKSIFIKISQKKHFLTYLFHI